GAGDDRIIGASGNDDLQGARGMDSISGGGGDDRLNGGADIDACDGGRGTNAFVACETLTAAAASSLSPTSPFNSAPTLQAPHT
ncbi:MAG: hypothetical protein V7605_2290, partial [Acidimicrobiaceae bacterium]